LAKRKRRNEVELLRHWDESSEFLFSPLPSRSTSSSPSPLPANLRSKPTPPPNSPPPAPRDPSPRDSPTLEPVSPILELPGPPVLPDSPPTSCTPWLPASPQNVAPPVADTATTATSPPSSTPAPSDTGLISTIPAAPPMSSYFPSCAFKVICRYCFKDDHDIRYKQCPRCYKKKGGTNYFGW
jgi:hypothetical protein